MILIAFMISFVYVTASHPEDSAEPEESMALSKCCSEFSTKFSKSWLHFILIMYKSSKARITILVEILIHFGLFLIASGLSEYITVFGQLALLELSSIFLFTFIEAFFLQQAYYYYDLLWIVIFYTADAVFFFNAIPILWLNWMIYGIFHTIAFAISFSQFYKEKNCESNTLPFETKKIISIGIHRGKNCILVESVEPKEVQLIQLDTMRIIGHTPLSLSASLKSYLAQQQLIIIQEGHKLDIFSLSNFKMIKQYDMENTNIKTAESARVEKFERDKLEYEDHRRESLKSKVYNKMEDFGERKLYNGNYEQMNSNHNTTTMSPNIRPTLNTEEDHINKKPDLENQKITKTKKLYLVHETKPLIAEIQMINDETNIRIINFLTNFEERKLQLTMPIFHPEQLIQFVRIDGSDKIFFKSPQNSFCLVDINRNLSDIVKQFAQKENQCTIINERDLVLAESENIYLYDIPANLFVKKITKFHMGSHIFPIQNAPGFYLVLPSEDHSHRLHPDVAQLIKDQLFSFRIMQHKISKSMGVKNVIYDSDSKKLLVFTDYQLIKENNLNLVQAEQPIVSDHVILDVSIYQQAQQDY